MHTPPIRSHTIHVTNSPTSSSPSLKPPSSVTRLPSVTSATSSFSSLHPSLRVPSPLKSPRQSGKPEVVSRQDTGSKRSVRWLDEKRLGKDSRGSTFSSGKKTEVDPAEVWARYIQTVRPRFKLHEPSGYKFGKGGGGGGGKGMNSKGILLEPEDDSRYVLKLSLPCPSDAGCCFCVYSRQLGPVRVYFSNFRRANNPQPASKGSKSVPGNNVAQSGNGSKEANAGNGCAPNGNSVPKERCLNGSVHSGEIIVPDPPEDCEESYSRRRHAKCKPTHGDLGGVGISKDPWLRNSHRIAGTRCMDSTTKEWLRNAAPSKLSNYSTYPIAKDTLRNPGHLRSVTFQNGVDDDRKSAALRSGWGSSPRTPRNSPRSHNSSSVWIASARSVKYRDRKAGNYSIYDHMRGPPPFPRRERSMPLSLLSKRQGDQ